MIVTTTNSVEGQRIDRYLGVVSAHVVAGTGLFSDVAASFSDIFGGRSTSYQRQVASIYKEALDRLITSAQKARASALVGVKVDVDEIGGGGKSMMMITATGTAVRFATSQAQAAESAGGFVDHREVIDADKLARLADGDPNKGISKEDIEFLVERRDASVLPRLIRAVEIVSERYLDSSFSSVENMQIVEAAKRVIDALPVSDSAAQLRKAYKHSVGTATRFFHERIAVNRAGDLDEAEVWLQSDDLNTRKRGTILAFLPLSFGEGDVAKLERLATLVESVFPETSREVEQGGLIGRKMVVECGYCDGHFDRGTCLKCKRDARGFKPDEMPPDDIVSHLRSRARALASLLA